MRSVRSLLAVGNGKLGRSIHHFDLPVNKVCCPGRSRLCRQACYAKIGRFRTDVVRRKLAWNYRQSLLPDFAGRMAQEIHHKGVLVVRLHVSGDFASAKYAEKWLEVMRACPQARYYFYTRSWRLPAIAPVLERMAALECCRAWYSIDDETGRPEVVPSGVRLAYLQTRDGSTPVADLVFRTKPLRRAPAVSLPLICPHETPAGKEQGANCGNCGHCWR